MENDFGLGTRLRMWSDDQINLYHRFKNYNELAKILNIQPSTLSDYFRGKHRMGGKILRKLQELGCNIDWLLQSDEETYRQKTAKEALEEKEFKEKLRTGEYSLTFTWDQEPPPGCRLVEVKAEWVQGFEGIITAGDTIGVNSAPYIVDSNDLVFYESANTKLVRIVNKSAFGVFLSAPQRNNAMFPEPGSSMQRIEVIFKKYAGKSMT